MKTEIIEKLGETAVLLPALISDALAANERLKLRLSLLQAAAVQARAPARAPHAFADERRAAGLEDPRLDALIAGARSLGDGRLIAPGAAALLEGVPAELEAMRAPLEAAQAQDRADFQARIEGVVASLPSAAGDELDAREVAALTSVKPEADSLHRLVMDLHKAIDRLAADTAAETVDGARAHGLDDAARAGLRAFMTGLNRTASLAFGHPGLGTTAARSGARLVIENDIGETETHVVVVHVEGLEAVVTYTDVHARRVKFFMSLFEDEGVAWSPTSDQAAGGDERFFLVTGRYRAPDEAGLDRFLERLGSRIVFLIDWNKARKALQAFVERDAAIQLLGWAAEQEIGHRAFLELGGADLVFDAVRGAAAERVPYGARLDGVLGAAETQAFLRVVLREASEGLAANRSARLIRDEIRADLAQRFESVESALLAVIVRHLGLSRTLAAWEADALSPASDASLSGLAGRALRMEAKADRLTLEARRMCGRLSDGEILRTLVDEAENAMDSLDECAFLMSLAPEGRADPRRAAPLVELADIVVDGVGQLIRAAEAAARLPDGRRTDAAAALQALDAAVEAERRADVVERAAISAFAQAADARALVFGLEVARALETATDHLAHAALALRERVLHELSG